MDLSLDWPGIRAIARRKADRLQKLIPNDVVKVTQVLAWLPQICIVMMTYVPLFPLPTEDAETCPQRSVATDVNMWLRGVAVGRYLVSWKGPKALRTASPHTSDQGHAMETTLVPVGRVA